MKPKPLLTLFDLSTDRILNFLLTADTAQYENLQTRLGIPNHEQYMSVLSLAAANLLMRKDEKEKLSILFHHILTLPSHPLRALIYSDHFKNSLFCEYFLKFYQTLKSSSFSKADAQLLILTNAVWISSLPYLHLAQEQEAQHAKNLHTAAFIDKVGGIFPMKSVIGIKNPVTNVARYQESPISNISLQSLISDIENANLIISEMPPELFSNLASRMNPQKINECISALITTLRNHQDLSRQDLSLCEKAIHAINALVPHASQENREKYLSTLIPLCNHQDDLIRRKAIIAISSLALHASQENREKYLSTLISLCNHHQYSYIRQKAIETIGSLTPHLNEVNRERCLSTLIPLCNHQDYFIRRSAIKTIGSLAPHLNEVNRERCLSTLIPLCNHQDESVCQQAIETIGSLVPHLNEVDRERCLSTLILLCNHQNYYARQKAIETIGSLVPHLNEVNRERCLSTLISLCNHQHSSIYQKAIETIGSLAFCISKEQAIRIMENIINLYPSPNENKINRVLTTCISLGLAHTVAQEKFSYNAPPFTVQLALDYQQNIGLLTNPVVSTMPSTSNRHAPN